MTQEKPPLQLVRGLGVEGVEEQLAAQAAAAAPDVLVATPTLFGTPCIEYQVSLMETAAACRDHGINLGVAFVRGDPFVGKARNNLIMQFLEKRARALFFIDDDQGWDAGSFLRILAAKPPIVAAAVPKKMDELTFNNVDLVTDSAHNCEVSEGLLRVRTVGTGFMRLTRAAVDKFISAYPETYEPGDGSQALHHRFFEPGGAILQEQGKAHPQFWGEDLVFCKKWTALGERLWIDPNVQFSHVGRKAWAGNFLRFLQANCKVQLVAANAAA